MSFIIMSTEGKKCLANQVRLVRKLVITCLLLAPFHKDCPSVCTTSCVCSKMQYYVDSTAGALPLTVLSMTCLALILLLLHHINSIPHPVLLQVGC